MKNETPLVIGSAYQCGKMAPVTLAKTDMRYVHFKRTGIDELGKLPRATFKAHYKLI